LPASAKAGRKPKANLGFEDELFVTHGRWLYVLFTLVWTRSVAVSMVFCAIERSSLACSASVSKPPRMIGPGFEKLCRGFCVRQFLHKFKVRLSVGPCELDHLGIVFFRAFNGRRGRCLASGYSLRP
jgi:hypothetical protein